MDFLLTIQNRARRGLDNIRGLTLRNKEIISLLIFQESSEKMSNQKLRGLGVSN